MNNQNNSKIVDFQDAKKSIENETKTDENVQALKNQIEQNLFLQRAIKIVSNIALYEKDEKGQLIERNYDYESLLEDYKKDSLAKGKKFESLGEPDGNKTQFYYQLFQFGYRTFGAEFFKQMCMNDINCVQLFIGVWALIQGLESMSEGLATLDRELRAYKVLSLTAEQKEVLAKEMSKTPQEYIEELMKEAEKLEKENQKDNN